MATTALHFFSFSRKNVQNLHSNAKPSSFFCSLRFRPLSPLSLSLSLDSPVQYFSGVVAHLRNLLDTLAHSLGPSELAKAQATFKEAIALEKAFWDMAWGVHSEEGALEQPEEAQRAACERGNDMNDAACE